MSYAVQVEIPENQMTSTNDINEIPVLSNESRPVLGDVATVKQDTTYGENDNLGALPFLSVTANLNNKDLGTATKDVKAAIQSLGELPRGLIIETKGLTEVLSDTLSSLQLGLITAVVVIFLMLAANFQSFKVSLVVLSTVPAVLLGSLAMLLLTGSTLNLQSYMGIIMSVGVSIANSVLLITNAEHLRRHTGNALLSAKESAALRIRPILMTTVAMVVGMMPMASGLGEGGDQAAPLGRAVMGGLIASTFAALFILPLVFSWVQGKASTASVSLDPEDKESAHYIPELNPSEEITFNQFKNTAMNQRSIRLSRFKNRLFHTFLIMALFCSCHSEENSGKKKTETQPAEAPATEVFSLKKGRLSSSLQIPGELIAYQQVDLYAKENSFVKKFMSM